MKEYYECHITMVGNPVVIKPIVENTAWKFSCIDGDPVLGTGLKCYATMLYNGKHEKNVILEKLHKTASEIESSGIEVIRRKIENVIFDDRSSKVNFKCNGGCPECHLDDLST